MIRKRLVLDLAATRDVIGNTAVRRCQRRSTVLRVVAAAVDRASRAYCETEDLGRVEWGPIVGMSDFLIVNIYTLFGYLLIISLYGRHSRFVDRVFGL